MVKLKSLTASFINLIGLLTELKAGLKSDNLTIPVEPILVMANQRTEIEELPKSFTVKYGKQLPKYIRELPNTPDILTQQQIRNLVNQFKSSQIHWKRKTHANYITFLRRIWKSAYLA